MNSGSPAPLATDRKTWRTLRSYSHQSEEVECGRSIQAPPDVLEILLERSRFAAVTRS